MKVGVNVGVPGIGLPAPTAIPAQVARFQAAEPPPFVWVMPPFIEGLKAAGKTGLARCQWRPEAGWSDPLWLEAWAENVDVELHEFGNEPGPDQWSLYRTLILAASPRLRAAGRKVVLAAPRTNRTTEWLATTPDKVWGAVDGVALHPYSKHPRNVLANVQAARPLVPKHLPLYVTEFGWAVDTLDHPLVVQTEHEQAEKIGATLALLREHADDLKLKLASVFMHRDVPENGRWWRHAGLMREDGAERPAFDVLAKAMKTDGDAP